MVRCKFKVQSITKYEQGSKIDMFAVHGGSKENEAFFKYTPSANLILQTVNEEASKQFEVGKEYYIDISLVE